VTREIVSCDDSNTNFVSAFHRCVWLSVLRPKTSASEVCLKTTVVLPRNGIFIAMLKEKRGNNWKKCLFARIATHGKSMKIFTKTKIRHAWTYGLCFTHFIIFYQFVIFFIIIKFSETLSLSLSLSLSTIERIVLYIIFSICTCTIPALLW